MQDLRGDCFVKYTETTKQCGLITYAERCWNLERANQEEILQFTSSVKNFLNCCKFIDENYQKFIKKMVKHRHFVLDNTLINKIAKIFSLNPEYVDQLVRIRVVGQSFERSRNGYWQRNNKTRDRSLAYFDQVYHLLFSEQAPLKYRPVQDMSEFWRSLDYLQTRKAQFQNGFTLFLLNEKVIPADLTYNQSRATNMFGILLDNDGKVYSIFYGIQPFGKLVNYLFEKEEKPLFYDWERMFAYTKRHYISIASVSLIFVVAAVVSVLTVHCWALLLAMFIIPVRFVYWLFDDDLDFSTNRLGSVPYDDHEIIIKYRYSIG